MAYNPYYPYLNYNLPYPNYAAGNQAQQPQQPQIQNGGMVFVQNENEILNYPVAPGNSMMFKIDNQPYVYVKTKEFSQMTAPTLEKYRLVKEEAQNQNADTVAVQVEDTTPYITKAEYDDLKKGMDKLRDDFEIMRKSINLFTDKELSDE